MIQLTKILVPYDFSPNSELALKYALEMASKFNAHIRLFHVVQDIPSLTVAGEVVMPTAAEYFGNVRTAASEAIGKVTVPDTYKDVSIEREVRVGNPHHEIVDAAKAYGIDLIILGTHGRTGLQSLFLGSVAERVVRHAPCPVLTVRMGEHEFVK